MSCPIFVVGTQRSGTTLLQAVLGAHPNIAAPPETYFVFRVANLADYFGNLRDDANLRRALHEALNPPIALFAHCGFDEERLYQRARRGERSYRALFDAILSDFAERHGKERWSEKTPNQRASAVFDIFPDAQVIHIVRDPRDVVASSLETPWADSAAQTAAWWRQFTIDNIRAGLKAGPAHFLQIRYEDLTSDPEAVMRLVCCFLQEDYDPEMVEIAERRETTLAPVAAPWQHGVLQQITAKRQGRHRETLSLRQRARVAAIAHQELPALGYAAPRRMTVAAGAALNLADTPRTLLRTMQRKRLYRRVRTPEDRYQEIQRYMQGTATHVIDQSRATSDPLRPLEGVAGSSEFTGAASANDL